MTTQHCPADLQSFGGVVDYAAERNGSVLGELAGERRPLPAGGHAAAAMPCWRSFSPAGPPGEPRWRWRGLAIGIAAGLLFSVVRIMQGAQFASATLWSAAVDWTVCAALLPAPPVRARNAPPERGKAVAAHARARSTGHAVGGARRRRLARLRDRPAPADAARRRTLCRRRLGDAALGRLARADAERAAVLPQAAALLLADGRCRWRPSASTSPRPGWRRSSAHPGDARAVRLDHAPPRRRAPIANATVLVLATMPFFFAARAVREPRHAGRRVHRAGDRLRRRRRARPARRRAASRGTLVLAWACAALGVLAKGLIGIVLPGLVLVVWLLVPAARRGRSCACSGRSASPSFVLIAAPWFVADAGSATRGSAHFFFVYQQFERFTAGGFNNAAAVVVLPGRRCRAGACRGRSGSCARAFPARHERQHRPRVHGAR